MSNLILAIDPGDVESAYCLYDTDNKKPIEYDKIENEELLNRLPEFKKQTNELAVEMIASYGMPVGRSIFDTCVWIGRYIQAWNGQYTQIFRKDVKMHLCHTMRAKDSNVRQALMDRHGSDRQTAIGTKKNPGPLYKMSQDMWAAYGVAVTFVETKLNTKDTKSI